MTMDKNANGTAQPGYRVIVSVAIFVPESVNYFKFYISNCPLPIAFCHPFTHFSYSPIFSSGMAIRSPGRAFSESM
jgi:hypothetical protein